MGLLCKYTNIRNTAGQSASSSCPVSWLLCKQSLSQLYCPTIIFNAVWWVCLLCRHVQLCHVRRLQHGKVRSIIVVIRELFLPPMKPLHSRALISHQLQYLPGEVLAVTRERMRATMILPPRDKTMGERCCLHSCDPIL